MFACSSRPAKAAIKKTPGGDVDHIATLFSAINVSGNGWVSSIPLSNPWSALLLLITVDNNAHWRCCCRELTLEEFRLACLLAIDDEAEIKRVFQTLDEDNSGSIDKSEFTEVTSLLCRLAYMRKLVASSAHAHGVNPAHSRLNPPRLALPHRSGLLSHPATDRRDSQHSVDKG